MRNYIAQEAIELAEKGDYSRVNEVLKLLQEPYSEHSTEGKYTNSSLAYKSKLILMSKA